MVLMVHRLHRLKIKICVICGLVFNELELQSHTAIGTVEERSELPAGDIVLHIPRVPVIRDVEDGEARASLVLFPAKTNLQSFHHEQVKRHQVREASAFIAWSNEILLLVHE